MAQRSPPLRAEKSICSEDKTPRPARERELYTKPSGATLWVSYLRFWMNTPFPEHPNPLNMPSLMPEFSRFVRSLEIGRPAWARTQTAASESASKAKPPSTGVASAGIGPWTSMPRSLATASTSPMLMREGSVVAGTAAPRALVARRATETMILESMFEKRGGEVASVGLDTGECGCEWWGRTHYIYCTFMIRKLEMYLET